MPAHKKALLAAFAPAFKEAGFRKTAATWNRVNRETIEVFNVQCSQWEESYYFNAGIYLRGLGAKERVLVQYCHVLERIPDPELHGRESWERWMTLSTFDPPTLSFERERWLDLDPETRIDELRKFIIPLALCWLGRVASTDGIKNYLLQTKYPDGGFRGLVGTDTIKFLGLDNEPQR